MERNENIAPKKKERRVGTFTTGVVLVVAGIAMMVCLFFPKIDLLWLLRLSPIAIVSIGIETLLATRSECRIKYDWVAMLLCCLIVGAALCMFVVAWCFLNAPDGIYGIYNTISDY